MNPYAIMAAMTALGILGIAANAVRTGQSRLGDWVDNRDRSPIRFWITVGLYLVLAGTCVIFAWELARL